jgi:hypothetical protein
LAPGLQPRFELAPRPAVHAHLTALSAFPTADENRAAHAVEVGLLKRKGFADSEPRAPKQHDQRAQPSAIRAISDGAHHRDDLLDRRRIRRVSLALVARPAPAVVARHRRRRTTMAGDIQQNSIHESSLVVGWLDKRPAVLPL